MIKKSNHELNKLFDNEFMKHIENEYQKELFELAWQDFLSDKTSDEMLAHIDDLFKNAKQPEKYVEKAKFILIIIAVGLQLLNKLKKQKLSVKLQKHNTNLIMLTAYNLVTTIPNLLIIETVKSEEACLDALKVVNNFLDKDLFAFDNQQQISETQYAHFCLQLAQALTKKTHK